MIFDNFDSPGAFEDDILGYVPKDERGRVLFTKRHADSKRLGHRIDASLMTEDESLEPLLRRRPQNDHEIIHGGSIVRTLGQLALALDQAGAYNEARNLELQDFMQHYNDRREFMLKEVPDVWEYSRAVDDQEKEMKLKIFTTWDHFLRQIKENTSEKEYFLTLAAFFDPRKISELYFRSLQNPESERFRIFFNGEKWDTYQFGDVLSEFQRLSLLQMHSSDIENKSFLTSSCCL